MIKLKDRYFKLEIEYKPNKNMYLRVKDGSTLKVTCPKTLTRDEIIRFILSREDAIFKIIDKQENHQANSLIKIGKTICYEGQEYNFIIKNGHDDLKINKHEIIIYTKDADIDRALNIFYENAKKVLYTKIKDLEVKYLKVLKDYGYNMSPTYKFKLMKSRWGVCYTNKNTVVINEYLIHYPNNCLEAVLWHELLHFILSNHSKRFHEVLEFHMPKYKENVRLLKL